MLSFDGEPIASVIEQIKREGAKCANPDTDDALAAMRLTRRKGSAGDIVPSGSVLITFQIFKKSKKNDLPIAMDTST